MEQNPFTFLNQAIGQLLAINSPAIQTMGLDLFRGLAVIMIAWLRNVKGFCSIVCPLTQCPFGLSEIACKESLTPLVICCIVLGKFC